MAQKTSETKATTATESKPAPEAEKPTSGSLREELELAEPGSGSGLRLSYWKPSGVGDYVEGDVIRIFPGQFEQDVVTLRLDDGSLVNVGARREALLHRLLFEESEVKIHGRLCVIFDGERTSAAGRNYRTWRTRFRSAEDQPPEPENTNSEDDIPF